MAKLRLVWTEPRRQWLRGEMVGAGVVATVATLGTIPWAFAKNCGSIPSAATILAVFCGIAAIALFVGAYKLRR